jgi:hypothetical protein
VPFTLEAEDCGEHFLRVTESIPEEFRGIWNIDFRLVEHDVGEVEAADLISSRGKDAPDMTKLDLARLQAEPPVKKRH